MLSLVYFLDCFREFWFGQLEFEIFVQSIGQFGFEPIICRMLVLFLHFTPGSMCRMPGLIWRTNVLSFYSLASSSDAYRRVEASQPSTQRRCRNSVLNFRRLQ